MKGVEQRKLRTQLRAFTTVEQLVHEAYATHAILFRLGFTPEEVFVGTPFVGNGDPPGLYAAVILRAQGLQFVYNFGLLRDAAHQKEFERAYLEFAHAQPSMSREALDAIVHASVVWEQAGAFCGGLALKGFVFTAIETN